MGIKTVVSASAILTLLFACIQDLPAATDDHSVIVVSPNTGDDARAADEAPILAAIEKARQRGGGTIQINPGKYLIHRELKLASNITVVGTEQTVLKLPSPVLVTESAKQGQDFIRVEHTSELATGTSVEICPPAGTETSADSDETTYRVEIEKLEPGVLRLSEPLAHAVAKGSRVGYWANLFLVDGSNRNVRLENLTLDGGLTEGITMPGHGNRCAILAYGVWSYKDGPTAPPVENVQIVGCQIRNCYGRAVAMYAVARSEVKNCVIERIHDEGIDLDHFCRYCRAIGNTVKQSETGVTINDASYCTVRDNHLEDCGVGVTVWWWHDCPQENLDVENLIKNNVIISPGTVGISLGRRCFRNRVIGNVVEGGIKVTEPTNVVENNTLKETGSPSKSKRP